MLGSHLFRGKFSRYTRSYLANRLSATTVANYKALLELRSEIMNEFQGLRSRDRQNIAKDLRSKEIWKEKEDPEHITSSLILRRRNSRRREEAITTRCVISLAWLKTSWVIETRKAYQGWSFSFRIRNTIPLDSPVFDYAWDGDVEGLRVLFETKFASPHDMDIDGWTPLHVRRPLSNRIFANNCSMPHEMTNRVLSDF